MKPLPFVRSNASSKQRALREAGQTGSHLKVARTTAAGTRTATVPKHHEVAPGTLRSILRQAGISADEFDAL
jgi:predicted RNA binding protein YcfA (HicA-like mRNA interferase family)